MVTRAIRCVVQSTVCTVSVATFETMVDGEWTVPEPTMQDQLEVQAAAIAELAEIVAGGE